MDTPGFNYLTGQSFECEVLGCDKPANATCAACGARWCADDHDGTGSMCGACGKNTVAHDDDYEPSEEQLDAYLQHCYDPPAPPRETFTTMVGR